MLIHFSKLLAWDYFVYKGRKYRKALYAGAYACDDTGLIHVDGDELVQLL